MTQRESPPHLGGIDDDDEEKTSVGAAPEPEALRPGNPQPPRVAFGAKYNTPTAFTPQADPRQDPRQDPRSSAAMTAARPQPVPSAPSAPPVPAAHGVPPSDRDGHGPPKSQSMPRPPAPNATRMGLGSSGPQPLAADRGSSGPQPLTPQPSHAPDARVAPPPPPMHMTPLGMPAQSGMMPFGSQPPQQQGPPRDTGPYQSVPQMGAASGPMSVPPGQALAVRADQAPRENRSAAFHITRSRAYSFVLDARNQPIELGSGRFAKVYLGEERWLESKTDFRRPIVIKILQKGVGEEDHMRFQMEKELLERVQGHPNIVELFASGENEDPNFLPPSIRDKVDTEFMILEKLEMSLEERLKGSRSRGQKEELLQCDMRERLFRVLDYMIPIASAVEYAHLVRNICHRDIKPANVLVGLPDPNLRGSTLHVRLADFNVAKLSDEEVHFGMTQMKAAVPGTLFFQSPEQETNIIELLVNVQQGLPEVEYFEDFYIQIAKNDSFSLFNRNEQYPVLYADRARKRLVLGRPYREVSETNVRARIQKSVGRPADIYSLGATFYYLISGAYANPKTLYDAFHKFIEYERADENNTIEAYLRHEYSVINSLRAPKAADGSPEVAPADRFFSYKQFLDGNGELIDPNVMLIIAKCMIRNKPDSYCQAHDLETRGISEVVADLINLYSLYGFQPGARPTHLVHRTTVKRGALKGRFGSGLRNMWQGFLSLFRKKK
ncbi:MAG: protein kinase [Labilithrix sp.]|nr:protein kinase [Labilithrix sp.]